MSSMIIIKNIDQVITDPFLKIGITLKAFYGKGTVEEEIDISNSKKRGMEIARRHFLSKRG